MIKDSWKSTQTRMEGQRQKRETGWQGGKDEEAKGLHLIIILLINVLIIFY